MGLVICHDGKIFLYAAKEELNEAYYDLLVIKKIKQGYNELFFIRDPEYLIGNL